MTRLGSAGSFAPMIQGHATRVIVVWRVLEGLIEHLVEERVRKSVFSDLETDSCDESVTSLSILMSAAGQFQRPLEIVLSSENPCCRS